MRGVLQKNSEMATDFYEELIKLHRDGEHDARHGWDCMWHVHERTAACRIERLEVWQKDGAGDDKVSPACSLLRCAFCWEGVMNADYEDLFRPPTSRAQTRNLMSPCLRSSQRMNRRRKNRRRRVIFNVLTVH